MAKTPTIKITESKAYTINPTTKSANYVYDSTLTDKVNISFAPNLPKGSKKYTNARVFSYRKDNDLVVVVKFSGKNYIAKKEITSTIKNYYTEANAGTVTHAGTTLTATPSRYSSTYNSIVTTKDFTNDTNYTAVVGNNKSNTYYLENAGGDKIYDEKGNDNYKLTYSAGEGDVSTIKDYSGKDKYTMTGGSHGAIEDYNGKDEYKFEAARGSVYDCSGNDKYTVTENLGDDSNSIEITDMSGKDTYNIYDSDKYVKVTDRAGDDKWTLTEANNLNITDVKGNDKWTVKNIVRNNGMWDAIEDKAGNDKWTFENVKGKRATDSYPYEFSVIDYSGKDTYTIKGENGSSEYKHLKITDGTGITYSDKFTSGNDTYNVTKASYTDIVDNGGKNKFNVKGSSFISITSNGESNAKSLDKSNNDKYTVSGIAPVYNKKKQLISEAEYAKGVIIRDNSLTSSDTYNFSWYERDYTIIDNVDGEYNKTEVIDIGGTDTYNIANCKSIRVRDLQTKSGSYKNTFNVKNTGNFIIDVSGRNRSDAENYVATKDTYNVTSSTGSICDYSNLSNDTYNVSKLKDNHVTIQDWGGKGDVLNIKDAKAKNLVFMTDGGQSPNLYIYDKSTKGFVVLSYYYGDEYDAELKYKPQGMEQYYEAREFVDSDYKIETIKAGKTNVSKNMLSVSEMNALREDVLAWLKGESMVDVLTAAQEGTKDISELIAYFTKQA